MAGTISTIQYYKLHNKQIMDNTHQQIQLSDEERARQKEYKTIKDAMKAEIKGLSVEQLALKTELRQPHNGCGTKQATANLNRVDLRHLFIAYAIFRLGGGRHKNIPEKDYTYIANTGKIVRKDGKAITSLENAPNMDLVTKILDKYGARSKTVHLSTERHPGTGPGSAGLSRS